MAATREQAVAAVWGAFNDSFSVLNSKWNLSTVVSSFEVSIVANYQNPQQVEPQPLWGVSGDSWQDIVDNAKSMMAYSVVNVKPLVTAINNGSLDYKEVINSGAIQTRIITQDVDSYKNIFMAGHAYRQTTLDKFSQISPYREQLAKLVSSGDYTGLATTLDSLSDLSDADIASAIEQYTLAQTKLSLGAANSGNQVAAIKAYLNQYYPLPNGWIYVVTSTLSTQGSAGEYAIQAVARKTGFDDVPAGRVSVNPALYATESDAWAFLGSSFSQYAAPVFMLTQASCLREEALANPAIQLGGSAAPAVNIFIEPILASNVPSVPQGVSSSGQPPWDAQPDVTPAVQIPKVTGTAYGAGYVGTLAGFPDGFLDWLNLKVPNAANVKMILASQDLLDTYIEQYNQTLPQPTPPMEGDKGSKSLPTVELYTSPLMPEYGDGSLDGAGILPGAVDVNGAPQYEQKPPVNLATVTAASDINGGPIKDGVWLMLNQVGTDYLNMLSEQYPATLLKVSNIAAARNDLNSLIDSGNMSGVEVYLRDFDASKYATKPPPDDAGSNTTPPPGPESTNKTALILIGLGLIGLGWGIQTGRIKVA
jgi:hypothetical protein